jgi:hypothetical protein
MTCLLRLRRGNRLRLSEPRHPGKRLPRPSNTVLAQLSDRWRVIYDPLQWVLQRKESEERQKSSGWNNRSYCATKEGLIRRIRESCSEVDIAALATIKALPEWHADREQQSEPPEDGCLCEEPKGLTRN